MWLRGAGRFVTKPDIFNRKNLPGRRGNRITRCSNCSVSNKRQTRRQDSSTCPLVRSLESIELLEGQLAWHQVHLGYPSRSNSSKRTRETKTLTCPKLRTRNFKLKREKPLLFSGDPSLLLPNYFVLASENSNNSPSGIQREFRQEQFLSYTSTHFLLVGNCWRIEQLVSLPISQLLAGNLVNDDVTG